MFKQPGSLLAVSSGGVLLEEGTPVELTVDPKPPYLRIKRPFTLGVTPTTIPTTITRYEVGKHAPNHQIVDEANPGPDPLYVHQPMLMPLKIVATGTSLIVYVQPHVYTHLGARRVFPGAAVDLASHLPGVANQARRVLIYLDKDTNELEVVEGTPVLNTLALPVPYPDLPSDANAKVAGWVHVTQGQTVITQLQVDDGRDFINDALPITGTGETVTLPAATTVGQILMADDNLVYQSVIPMINQHGEIMTNADGTILIAG